MSERDLQADILEGLQDVSRQLGALTERVERVERDTNKLVATLHTGNGREAVVTRLAQVETKAKETRGRVITLEDDLRRKAPDTIGTLSVTRDLGFWGEYGKTVVPGIVALLLAAAAFLTALATRYGSGP